MLSLIRGSFKGLVNLQLCILQVILRAWTWPLRVLVSSCWQSTVLRLVRRIYAQNAPAVGNSCVSVLRLSALLSAGLASSCGMIMVVVIVTTSVYAVLYARYIPPDYQTYPVYFRYTGDAEPACALVNLAVGQRGSRGSLSDARAMKSKVMPALVGVKEVDVYLDFAAASSPRNMHLGPVMFNISLLQENVTLPPFAVSERPMLLPWRGFVSRLWNDISPFGSQTIESGVQLFEDLPVSYGWTFSQICMNPPLHVHEAELRFHSKLSMLKGFLRNRPVLGGIFFIGICTSFAAVLIGVLLIWAILSYFSQEPPLNKEPQWLETQLTARREDDTESTDHFFCDPIEPELPAHELPRKADVEDEAELIQSEEIENESQEGLRHRTQHKVAADTETVTMLEDFLSSSTPPSANPVMVPGGVGARFLKWRPSATFGNEDGMQNEQRTYKVPKVEEKYFPQK